MISTLAIDNVSVHFAKGRESIAAVRGASLTVQPAECVGIVGESGSGKTQLFMAAMGLLGPGARVTGHVQFEGQQILGASTVALNRLRGSKITMIFQDPITSLTPHLRIGVQLAEVLVYHLQMTWAAAEQAALRILDRVQVPEPQRRLRQYPHELSGGMRQRVMIGMSLLCEPSLLIADEPTTALDVTVQAQIMELLRGTRKDSRMAIVLISHDMGLVAGLAERMAVMYAGRVVESGATGDLTRRARHPYTAQLLKCVPDLNQPRLKRMPTLIGQPPSPTSSPAGCEFAPRCARAAERCRVERPRLLAHPASIHSVACHFPISA